MKTNKEIRKEIKLEYAGVPESEVYTGGYLKSIGTKFVTIVDTWDTTSLIRIPLIVFYNQYILGHLMVRDYDGNYYDETLGEVIA